MDNLNTWWKGLSGERFWLEVTSRSDHGRQLAAPRRHAGRASAWSLRLVTCVSRGDVVFHFDPEQNAVVGRSIAARRARTADVSWTVRDRASGLSTRRLSSWVVALEAHEPLPMPLSIEEIGQGHWHLFPALRALEDEFGDPLYYPFEMGRRGETRALDGYLFKLPALFVTAFPQLATLVTMEAAARENRNQPSLSIPRLRYGT